LCPSLNGWASAFAALLALSVHRHERSVHIANNGDDTARRRTHHPASTGGMGAGNADASHKYPMTIELMTMEVGRGGIIGRFGKTGDFMCYIVETDKSFSQPSTDLS
jgi:hypothetical protein